MAHFDGSSWTTRAASNISAFGLFGITGAPGVAWAVGEGDQIVHFVNGAWRQVQPSGGSFQGWST